MRRFTLPRPTLPSPTVHIPIYAHPKSDCYEAIYRLQQIVCCLNSYFKQGHTEPVLVTTNDRGQYANLETYRERSGYEFELEFVSEQALRKAFGVAGVQEQHRLCLPIMYSKFYPIVTGAASHLVHIDHDTLFVGRLPLRSLFKSPVTLVDANRFTNPCGISDSDMAHLGFPPCDTEASFAYLNAGVFGVHGRGFDICRELIHRYHQSMGRSGTPQGMWTNPEEVLFCCLALTRPKDVGVISDHHSHFLGRFLSKDSNWRRRTKLVHFNTIKPQNYRSKDGEIYCHLVKKDAHLMEDMSDNLLEAALLWWKELHDVNDIMDNYFHEQLHLSREQVHEAITRLRIAPLGN